MRQLLHPPGHRGPVIAAGGVVLALGVALQQARMTDWAAGPQLLIALALAVVLLWLGLQETLGEAPPPAYASVLLVTGLLASALALVRLAEVLGDPFADDFPAWTFVWIGAALAALAALVSVRRRSAVAALIAALAAGGAVLSSYDAIFDPGSVTPFRWVLLALMLAFAVMSLPLRGAGQRHAEQMVNAAGVAVAGIWLVDLPFFSIGAQANFSWWWETVIVVAGCGLVAYGAVDGAPGPAYLGVLNLLGFILVASGQEATLLIWPLVLLAGGLALLAVGLRPRVPLPPPPDASTAPGDQPLAARTQDGGGRSNSSTV